MIYVKELACKWIQLRRTGKYISHDSNLLRNIEYFVNFYKYPLAFDFRYTLICKFLLVFSGLGMSMKYYTWYFLMFPVIIDNDHKKYHYFINYLFWQLIILYIYKTALILPPLSLTPIIFFSEILPQLPILLLYCRYIIGDTASGSFNQLHVRTKFGNISISGPPWTARELYFFVRKIAQPRRTNRILCI